MAKTPSIAVQEDSQAVAQPGDVQAPDDFIIPDHGMTYAGGSYKTEYNFFAMNPWKPEEGAFLTVENSTSGETKVDEKLFLDFTPSAIYAHTNANNKILLGGIAKDKTVILVEFEFQFEGEFLVLKRAESFADVSLLGSICDLSKVEVNGEEVLFLLDGLYGLFGNVTRGGSFKEVSLQEHRLELIGKRSFLSHSFPKNDLRLKFSPEMPGACVDAEEEECFRLQSLDGGESFYALPHRATKYLPWDFGFEEPNYDLRHVGEDLEYTYEFWRNKRLKPTGPMLTVEDARGELSRVDLPLGFVPTAIEWLGPDLHTILLGGRRKDGTTMLYEIEIQSVDGTQSIVRQDSFGDVSALASLCDIEIYRLNGQEKVCVLDARKGMWGSVDRDGAFSEISTPEQRPFLLRKRYFRREFTHHEGITISFSPQEPGAHLDHYEDAWYRLRSLDNGLSFQEWRYEGKR